MSAHTSPRMTTVTTVHNGTRYAPQYDPTWSTAKGADIPDGTLAFYSGRTKAAADEAGRLVWVTRSGCNVIVADALDSSWSQWLGAASRMWITPATETITEAEANRCKTGFSARSNRVETCRHCDQGVDAHSHADPSDLSWDKTSRYAHLADRFHPVYVAPASAVIVCTDLAHVEGAPGCRFPQCAGIPPLDAATSRMQPVPAEAHPSECGTDTVGRALSLNLAAMTRVDVTMPVYRDSEWYDRRNARQVQTYTLAVSQGTRCATVAFVAYETRSALIGWHGVWSILVNGSLVTAAEGSAVISTARLTGDQAYATLAHRAACAIGARDTYGRVDGWTLPARFDDDGEEILTDADGASLGWQCDTERPAALVVFDNGLTRAACKSCASTYARENGERAVLPLPGGHSVASITPAPAPVAPVADVTPAPVADDAPDWFRAVRIGSDVHAGKCTGSGLVGAPQYSPVCGIGGYPSHSDPVTERITCGACKRRHAHTVDMIHAAHAVSPVAEAPATPDSTPATDSTDTEESTMSATDSTPAPGPESSLRAALAATPASAALPIGTLSVTVDRRALTEALAFLTKGIGRPTIPILSGVEISAHGDTVTLRTFDYETERVVTLPADVTVSGRGAVGCKALADLVKGKALTGARVTLTDTGSAMAVECGPARLSVETLPVQDMPSLGFTVEPFASLDIRTLAPALAITGRSAGTDRALPFLTGVQLNATDGALEMQSTDRYRVAFANVPTTGARSVFLVPPAALVAEVTAAMAKAAGKAGAPVIIGEHGYEGFRWMSLTCGAYHMVTRTLDGKQMPLSALKPVDAPHVGTVDAAALKSAVQTLAGVVGNTLPVILDWSTDTVTVRAAGQSGIPVPVEYAGEPVTVALNPAFLSDGLSVVKGRVTVAVAGGQKPVMITPADGADAPAGFEYMIVPIRIDGAAPAVTPAPQKEDTVSTATPARKTRARKAAAPAPATEAPAVPVETDAAAPEAPAVPATDPVIERAAQRALELMIGGQFREARTAIDALESTAPTGYLVGGEMTFDRVRSVIIARRSAQHAARTAEAPAPVAAVDQADAPAPVVDVTPAPVAEAPAREYPPVILTHSADGTALVNTPFVLRFKLSALLNGKRDGLGWTFGGAQGKRGPKAWIMDGSAGQPIDRARVAAVVAALVGIGVTVDDRTNAGPVDQAAPAPVAPAAEAPAPVVTPDAAVIDAARVAGAATLTGEAPAPVAGGTAVFDLSGELDLSSGYRAILKPARQALARAGVSVSVLNVGRRVTVVGKNGGALSAEACATVYAVMAETLPAAVLVTVSA